MPKHVVNKGIFCQFNTHQIKISRSKDGPIIDMMAKSDWNLLTACLYQK